MRVISKKPHVVLVGLSLLLSLMGCVQSRRLGPFLASKEAPSTVQYVDVTALPRQLDQADYHAIESVITKIPGLGNPVVVKSVFVAWENEMIKVAVLYRTTRHDIYLVRDSEGKWLLSAVTTGPVP